MKENLLSTCEKTFLLRAVTENVRLDNRQLNEYRKESIHFGTDWGSCLVTLGDTRVLAQVSCDIQAPKASKPNEGLLHVHVEMSPMAALHFESGRHSDISIQVNRLLEKCLKESKCVDLEALCIVAEEKVWNIRIDLNVMNYEGNLAGCCSIAAIAALAHFKHPDVTSTGEKIIIHSYAEKDPIPINLHHYPIIISYALFNDGKQILTDPIALEEKVADSLLLLSVNSYREICGIHLEGVALPSSNIVIKCSRNAVNIASHLVKQIKTALAEDIKNRSDISFAGLTESLNLDHIFSKAQEAFQIKLKRENTWSNNDENNTNNNIIINETDNEKKDENTDVDSSDESNIQYENELTEEDFKSNKYCVKSFMKNTAELMATNDDSIKMETKETNEISSDESDDIQVIQECKMSKVEEIELSSDSESEILVVHSTYRE